MLKKVLIFILLSVTSFQVTCAKDANCLKYDYSHLLMNNNILGCIGNGQRLYIHFDTVYKDKEKAELYHVVGKTRVKDNICSFTGNVNISRFKQVDTEYYPVKHYKMIAKYEFKEDTKQYGAGIFSGRLESDFFIYKDSVYMDEIINEGDGYCNNQYKGVWKSYKTNVIKKANFGIDRIPDDGGLDVGCSEFMVDRSKQHLGWETYMMLISPDSKGYHQALAEEQREWWKKDKEKFVTWEIKTEKRKAFANIYINNKYIQSVNLISSFEYTVEQDDYNFDGHRDICFSPRDNSSGIYFLWSPNEVKYIKTKADNITGLRYTVPELKVIITLNYDNKNNCVIWQMYQYINNNYINKQNTNKRSINQHSNSPFVLYSRLTSNYTTPGYLLEETFSPDGTVLSIKHNPTYDQLNPKWQYYRLYEHLDEIYNKNTDYSE